MDHSWRSHDWRSVFYIHASQTTEPKAGNCSAITSLVPCMSPSVHLAGRLWQLPQQLRHCRRQKRDSLPRPCICTSGTLENELFVDMMTSSNGNIFRVTGPLWGESYGPRGIPITKASDAEFWWFLWSAPEQMVEQTIETPVIWNFIALIVMLLKCYKLHQKSKDVDSWKKSDIHHLHDVVINWNRLLHYWPFVRGIHWWPVNSPHKDLWRGALIFSLICARINGWVNNREAGDLRRHHTHYDVTVMCRNPI